MFDSDLHNMLQNEEPLLQIERNQLAAILEKIARSLREEEEVRSNDEETSDESLSRKDVLAIALSENIIIITFMWQLICIGGLQLVDVVSPNRLELRGKLVFTTVLAILLFLQVCNLVLCISVTVKVFKQYKHKKSSMKFLSHSYIATLFLFGGIYTFIYWISSDTFNGVRGDPTSSFYALSLYSQFLFTSISTGTLCGTASVTGVSLASESIMSFQMLLSFLYFASILSEVVNPSRVKDVTEKDGEQEADDLIKRADKFNEKFWQMICKRRRGELR